MSVEEDLKQAQLEAKQLEVEQRRKDLNAKPRLNLAGAAVLVTMLGGVSAVLFQGIGLLTAMNEKEAARAASRSEFDFKGLELFLKEQDRLFGCDPDESLRHLTLFQTLFSDQITDGFSGIIAYRTQICLAKSQNAAVAQASSTAGVLEIGTAADNARYSAAAQQSALLDSTAGSSLEQYRVFIQIGDDADRATAAGLQAALTAAGYAAPGVDQVDAAPFNYQVRYYYKDQVEDARKLASVIASELALEGTGATIQLISLEGRFGSLPKETMEFWFPKRKTAQ